MKLDIPRVLSARMKIKHKPQEKVFQKELTEQVAQRKPAAIITFSAATQIPQAIRNVQPQDNGAVSPCVINRPS